MDNNNEKTKLWYFTSDLKTTFVVYSIKKAALDKRASKSFVWMDGRQENSFYDVSYIFSEKERDVVDELEKWCKENGYEYKITSSNGSITIDAHEVHHRSYYVGAIDDEHPLWMEPWLKLFSKIDYDESDDSEQ